MAKEKAKATLATVETKTPAEKEKKEKRVVSKASAKIYAIKDASAPEVKMPLQCKQIMAILNAAPGKVMQRETLLEEMAKVVVTRQPIERIFGFYQSRLIAGGYIKVEAAPKPVAAPKEKVAKAAEATPTPAVAPAA